MTKQDELREELAKLEHEQWVKWSMSVAQSEDISEERLERWKGMWVPYDKLPEDVKNQDRIWANKSLSYLHSQGVVIKVERELPGLKKANMKLGKLKKVIDKAVIYAETTNPSVEFWVGENEYELDSIGQFHVMPDLAIHIKDAKAGYEAVEPLIIEDKAEGVTDDLRM